MRRSGRRDAEESVIRGSGRRDAEVNEMSSIVHILH